MGWAGVASGGFFLFVEDHKVADADFGFEPLVAVLVGVAAVHEAPFGEDILSFGKVFLREFRGFAPGTEVVPLGEVVLFALGIFVRLISGEAEVDYFSSVVDGAYFGVVSEVSDEGDLVYNGIHDFNFFCAFGFAGLRAFGFWLSACGCLIKSFRRGFVLF